MSANAFMLPAPPQLPAPGLSGPNSRSAAAFKTDRGGLSADSDGSFSATLKRISDRYDDGNSTVAPEAKRSSSGKRADAQSASPQKKNKTAADASAGDPDNEATGSSMTEKITPFHPGWLAYYLMNPSSADDGAAALQPLSDPASGSRFFTLGDWIESLQGQGLQIEGELSDIGAFEPLQVSIAPEAANRFFFEQLAFRVIDPRGDGSQPGEAVRVSGFSQWISLLATSAAAGALNGQTESVEITGDLLKPLPAMGATATVSGVNMETGGSGGPNGAVSLEMAQLNADLLKMAAPSQGAETDLSESAKMVFSAPGDAGSETPPEAQARQLNANFQPLKLQADLQVAAESPAHPNSTTEGVSVKSPEEVFGIKGAAFKADTASDDGPDHKILHIDGDSKDSGLLFSQSQMPPHLARLENSAHSSEIAQRSLIPQTLDQIVQKAALSFKNGQHEVQIDLKPDFLGHIRMQIVSEGHQVAIKIMAELPFVKDMLENNLHQLRAVLQAQGLNIDELEVSVAQDSHAEGDTRQNAEPAKVQTVRDSGNFVEGPSEKQDQFRSQGGGAVAETAIDYFA